MTDEIIKLAKDSEFDPAVILAFISVETGGKGFDDKTGKLLVQFEPTWFKRKAPFVPSGLWSVNKVDVQSREWEAFAGAFYANPNAAMESTSIGLGQIMGFHWKRLGYASVALMWDDANKSVERQFYQLIQFIKTDSRLQTAIKAKDWDKIASIYNGAGYKALAEKIGREPYNVSMQKAF